MSRASYFLSLLALIGTIGIGLSTLPERAFAQRDLGEQAETRETLREQQAQQEVRCFCTRRGSVGPGSSFCTNIRGISDCARMNESPDYQSGSEAHQAILGQFTCRSVESAQFVQQTSPTDTAHLCPNQPYASLNVAITALAPPTEEAGEARAAEQAFTSVTPQLGVPIPGLVFSPATREGGLIEVPFLAQYISAIQRYLTGLAAVAAVIMVTYGGFLYLLGSSAGEIGQGKAIITDAILGFLIALGGYLILQTVNPNLLNLQPLSLTYIDPIALEVDQALGHVDGGTGFEEAGGIMCVAFDQCPEIQMITVKQLLLEVAQTDEAAAQRYLRKIFDCTGNELRGQARNACRSALQQKLNINMKPLFLTLFQRWPDNAGRLKIGEIHRRTETQFNGFFPLRVPCGPLLSGFPAPRSACPRGGHGTGSGMDVWYVPPNAQGTNNCAEVVPGKPFPQFMHEVGWVHLCHEDWHFEPSAAYPSARTNNTWRNIPCFGGSADRYLTALRCDTSTPRPTPTPEDE